MCDGADGARTRGLQRATLALSQLSYGPKGAQCSCEFVDLRAVDAALLVVLRELRNFAVLITHQHVVQRSNVLGWAVPLSGTCGATSTARTLRCMSMRTLLVSAALLLLAVTYFKPGGSPSKGPYHADLVRTPGVANPDVTQSNVASTICKHGWTRRIRPPTDYTNALKQQQMREYGVRGSLSEYQEDHLISLELGGHPTDPRNLWPEPYPRAAEVDTIENQLNGRVCSGELTLDEAQRKESELKHTDG